jgi:hypothetical protein
MFVHDIARIKICKTMSIPTDPNPPLLVLIAGPCLSGTDADPVAHPVNEWPLRQHACAAKAIPATEPSL